MDIFPKLYRFYYSKIYPHVNTMKGTTRLKGLLKTRAIKNLQSYDGEPTSIFQSGDWENLIILDACRYDKYNELRDYEVESRTTLGSTSSQYVQRSFTEEDYDDIVYINGNGFLTDTKLEELIGQKDIFHAKFDTIEEKWDDKKGTVQPEKIVEDALTAEKLFPDKKKIIHFIQPHYPFLNNDFSHLDHHHLENQLNNVLELAERGLVSQEEIEKAYEENLEIVLEHAEKLSDKMGGKTVITADHGELLGEKGLYSHPDSSNAKKLRKVPWDEI